MERLQTPTTHDLFQSLCGATVRHACVLLRLAGTSCPMPRVAEMLRSAPRNVSDARSPAFHAESLCCETLRVAARWFRRPDGNAETHSAFKDAEWHFLGVIPRLHPSRRRQLEAAVEGVVTGMQLGQRHLPLRADDGQRGVP
jgi:hypothetical protein